MFALSLAALVVCVVAGAASDVESGPDKGAKVPALKVYDATGENKEKTVDYAALRKDKATVYLLVAADKWDRPMYRFTKKLDEKVKADHKNATVIAVWLTDDEDKTKEYLPKIATYYESTALTAFKGKDGPKGWNVNNDAHLTVVVAAKGKVAARFGYKSVNDTDVPAVLRELKQAEKAKK